jgi:hypothetical protein
MSVNAKNLFFITLNFNINFLNRLFSNWIDLIEKVLICDTLFWNFNTI